MPGAPIPQAAAKSPRFISLKWKTLALVSLALSAIYLVLVVHGYREALEQFKARQSLSFEQRVGVLHRLLQQSDARLQRIAAVVPGVINATTMAHGFTERWDAVQVDLGLEAMQLYGRDGELHVRGLPIWGDTPPPELLQRVKIALHDEQPSGFLLCRPRCLQYALIPTLDTSGNKQLMVLGLSLADVVLEFPGLAGADIAVLVAQPGAGASYWGRYQLAAISDAPSNEPKIRAVSEDADLLRLEQGGGLNFGGRSYRFYARPLRAFNSLSEGYFLIFSDTTEALADIKAQMQRLLAGGLTALLTALLLLLTILNRPMGQLHKLAEALPLLAQREYASARAMIGNGASSRRSQTEIEVLELAAADLSHKLETLEQTVEARNQSLAEKISELKRAHELNDKIFATAPMLILIQSSEGKILQMNDFGSQLLGYSPSEVQGMSYLSLLADTRLHDEAANVLVDVISGRRPLFEQTGPVRCVDGSLERITWLHTRLAAQSGTYILSVGLPDKSLQETS